jgi:hypothetical protein
MRYNLLAFAVIFCMGSTCVNSPKEKILKIYDEIEQMDSLIINIEYYSSDAYGTEYHRGNTSFVKNGVNEYSTREDGMRLLIDDEIYFQWEYKAKGIAIDYNCSDSLYYDLDNNPLTILKVALEEKTSWNEFRQNFYTAEIENSKFDSITFEAAHGTFGLNSITFYRKVFDDVIYDKMIFTQERELIPPALDMKVLIDCLSSRDTTCLYERFDGHRIMYRGLKK